MQINFHKPDSSCRTIKVKMNSASSLMDFIPIKQKKDVHFLLLGKELLIETRLNKET